MCIYVCIYIYIHKHVYIYMYTYVCVYIYTYIYVYIYILTCIYTHVHMNIHIYIQVRLLGSKLPESQAEFYDEEDEAMYYAMMARNEIVMDVLWRYWENVQVCLCV